MPNEERENLYWIPILDDSVWEPLQKKNYADAELALGSILESLSPHEWNVVFWAALIEGFPIVRGELTEKEWRENVQPMLARLVLQIASGEATANIFSELVSYPDTAQKFETLLIYTSTTADVESEIKIKKINRPLYTFLIASPAQELFSPLSPYRIARISSVVVSQRYTTIPEKLKDELFSYATAEDIARIAGEQHLSPEKTNVIATLTGRVLLGFLHLEDMKKEIQKTLDLDPRLTDAVYQALDKKIFSEFKDEIHEVYDPVIIQTKPSETGSSPEPEEKTITFAGLEKDALGPEENVPVRISSAPIEEKKEDNPFVLQEEKPLETAGGTMTGKKFSFSLGGFFKPKKKDESVSREPVKAKIELFGGDKDEKRVIHYSELRTPLEAREEDIFKLKEEQPISPIGQIGPIGPIGQIGPIGSVGSPTSPISPIDSNSASAPSPLTPPSTKKSPWAFKWFGSQAPARDEQKAVPENKTVGETSFEEKPEEKKEKEPVSPISQIGPINPISPIGSISPITDEPKNPTIEGNIVDLRTLKK